MILRSGEVGAVRGGLLQGGLLAGEVARAVERCGEAEVSVGVGGLLDDGLTQVGRRGCGIAFIQLLRGLGC